MPHTLIEKNEEDRCTAVMKSKRACPKYPTPQKPTDSATLSRRKALMEEIFASMSEVLDEDEHQAFGLRLQRLEQNMEAPEEEGKEWPSQYTKYGMPAKYREEVAEVVWATKKYFDLKELRQVEGLLRLREEAGVGHVRVDGPTLRDHTELVERICSRAEEIHFEASVEEEQVKHFLETRHAPFLRTVALPGQYIRNVEDCGAFTRHRRFLFI